MALFGAPDGFTGGPESYSSTTTITAETLSLSISGDIVLTVSRKLPSDSAAFVLTGNDVYLLKNNSHYLSCDIASFSVVGTATAIVFTRVVTCGSASFTCTANSATLQIAEYRLVSDARPLALLMQAATVSAARKLLCYTSPIALNGQPVAVIKQLPLICVPGSVSLSGTTAQLTYSRYTSWIIQSRQSSSWQAA